MLAEAVNCTHNGTGGSGTITLTSVTGYPQVTDVFGTSGTMFVHYTIAEYTDSTLVTLANYESGTGSIVLSTNVLTRTYPRITWVSGGAYDNTTPAALSFGNTAANVRVMLTSGHISTQHVMPRHHDGSTGATTDSWNFFNDKQQWDSSATVFTLVDGTKYWCPITYVHPRPIASVAVRVGTGQAAKDLRMGIYDWDPTTGLPLNLLNEFTSVSQISLVTGSTFASVSKTAYIQPGNYYLCIQSNSSTATIMTTRAYGNCRAATLGAGRDLIWFSETGTYGALPTTSDQAGLTAVSLSTNNHMGLLFK